MRAQPAQRQADAAVTPPPCTSEDEGRGLGRGLGSEWEHEDEGWARQDEEGVRATSLSTR